MKLMEVRCCCVPEKLLGYLPEPMYGASRQAFPLTDEPSRTPAMPFDGALTRDIDGVVLEVHTFSEPFRDPPVITGPMSLDKFRRMQYRRHLAYKAEGLSIETLRRIPGFLEAVHP